MNQKWYEADPELNQLMEGIQQLPSHYQLMFATILASLVARVNQQLAASGVKLPTATEAGTSFGLVKSQQKRRWYDHDPKLFEAINALYVLPELLQVQVAMRLNPSLLKVNRYLIHCQEQNVVEDMEHIKNILFAVLAQPEPAQAPVVAARPEAQPSLAAPMTRTNEGIDEGRIRVKPKDLAVAGADSDAADEDAIAPEDASQPY